MKIALIMFNFIVQVYCKVIFNFTVMNKFHKETLKERLLKLAELKCTGTPSDLAVRFEISERSVKRMVRELKEEGTQIRYSQVYMSYVTD